MRAIIFDIERGSFVDGPGIRTTVFFKGCNLKCAWCHNPESQSGEKQMLFYKNKCTHCGKCKEVCHFDLEKCDFCGKCELHCPNDARKICGKEMSVDEVLGEVIKDKAFYDASGGGVTLSGGECLLYPEFCVELLKLCKANGINTAIDTCGYVNKNALNAVIPYTDTFLYDLKAYDEDIHIKCTSVSNKLILENLRYLDSQNCRIEIRIPYVPEYNDNQIEKLAGFIHTLKNAVRVKILPYHNYAASKYAALNIKNTLPDVRLPEQTECADLEQKYMKSK